MGFSGVHIGFRGFIWVTNKYNYNHPCGVKTRENPVVNFRIGRIDFAKLPLCRSGVTTRPNPLTGWFTTYKNPSFPAAPAAATTMAINTVGRDDQGLLYVTLGLYTAARPTQSLTSSRSTDLIDNTLSCLQCFTHRTTGNNSHAIASECPNCSRLNLIFCLFRVAISLPEIINFM